MNSSSSRYYVPILILILLSLFLFFFKITMPLTDGDTAFYGRIAYNATQSGNWQSLHYQDNDFVDKPPFSIWPMSLSYRLLGFNDVATKGWHALLAVLTVLLIYLIARELYSQRAAFWAGIVFATTILMFYSGQVPQQDVPAVFCAALSFLGLLRFLRTRKLQYFYLIWLGIGLSTLNRALAGIAIPAGILIFYLLLRKILVIPLPRLFHSRRRAILHWALGLIVLFITGFSWFALETAKRGPEFLNYFFGAGNTRYVHNLGSSNSGVDFWVEVPLLIAAFIPWAGFLWHSLKKGWIEKKNPSGGSLFLLTWFIVSFAFTLAVKWRVIRYLLPCLPPLAIFVGAIIDGVWGDKLDDLSRKAFRVASISNLVLVAPLLLGLIYVSFTKVGNQDRYLPLILPFLTVLLGGMLLFSILSMAGRYRWATVSLVTFTMVSYLVLMNTVDRNINMFNPWSQMSLTALQARQPEDITAYLPNNNPFLTYYLREQPLGLSDLADLQRETTSGRLMAARQFFLFTDSPLKPEDVVKNLARPATVSLMERAPMGQSLYLISFK